MRLFRQVKKALAVSGAMLKAKLFKIGSPLAVGWAITSRCNQKCAYCAIWQKETEEITTEEACKIVDELSAMGTLMISFTGGEPLMRDDMGRIVDHIHSKGIAVKINSNGALVPTRIGDLRNVDILNLSLDGTESVHDASRGSGSFRLVMEAAKIAVSNGIRVNFVTVLNKTNLDSVDFILEKAKELRGNAVFQPAAPYALGSSAPDPLVPDKAGYRKAIEELIEKKKRGAPIGSSVSTLRHLMSWPDPTKINCASGWISCRIEPNGDMISCSRDHRSVKPPNCVRDGVKKAFDGLVAVDCSQCWCAGRVELNHVFCMDLSTICDQVTR